jgi:hypothetical protein
MELAFYPTYKYNMLGIIRGIVSGGKSYPQSSKDLVEERLAARRASAA